MRRLHVASTLRPWPVHRAVRYAIQLRCTKCAKVRNSRKCAAGQRRRNDFGQAQWRPTAGRWNRPAPTMKFAARRETCASCLFGRSGRASGKLEETANSVKHIKSLTECPSRVKGALVTGIHPMRLAESEGFEPPIRCRIPDFESGAFDHSANSPRAADYTGFRRATRPRKGVTETMKENGGRSPRFVRQAR